jgi:hypothetical protein
MLGYAADGIDVGFDVEDTTVVPFRRPGSATINPGDAA